MVEFGPGVAVWFVTGLLGEVSFRSGSILGALASAAARAERFLALLGRPFISVVGSSAGAAKWFVTGLLGVLGEVSFRSGRILGALASAAARAERFLALLGRPFISAAGSCAGAAEWFVAGSPWEVSFRSGRILGVVVSGATRAVRVLALLGRLLSFVVRSNAGATLSIAALSFCALSFPLG
jgi:hypothetical protein